MQITNRVDPNIPEDKSCIVYVGYFEVGGVVMHNDKIADGIIGECRRWVYYSDKLGRRLRRCGLYNRRHIYLTQNRDLQNIRCNEKINAQLRLYGRDAFKLEILRDGLTKDQAQRLEENYRPWPDMGLNRSSGGGNIRCTVSQVSRNKMSLYARGRILSKKTKAKISIGNKGKIVSDETRAKLSKIKMGVKRGPYKKRKK